ncbi:MAG: hypothetical protein KAU21_05805, partial [Gammaproteobacteria bacterium]|nr:hypothetical protein [Gammaproteobacteria bacterium]
MTDNADMERPPWLQEQPAIERLLQTIIYRRDKNPDSKTGLTLNKKILPELFELGEDSDLIWNLFKTLFDGSNPVFTFHENKKRNFHDPVYTDARIRFLPQSEVMLRQWLDRPVQKSELKLWQTAVEQHKNKFPGEVERLYGSKISVSGKTPEDIVEGFLKINKYHNDELTLRNLSPRCFWQDSKFLDNREELIRQLYPHLRITTRPVMVSVYLPENVHGILFIENQDSYTQAIRAVPNEVKNMALVYSAGFKLSAQRIRKPYGVSLHFHDQSSQQLQQKFLSWWYVNSQNNWPVYFWGDLDYAGMDIL